MTIASEISRLQTAKANIKSSIEWKWVEVWSDIKLDEYSDYIDQIQQCEDVWVWIYWNPDFWVISLSSDWINWMTIADKNLWATKAYNDPKITWSNKSEYVWKTFQRWNNYWFLWNSSYWVDPITTRVTNANNYWPWNYFSSSSVIAYRQWWWLTDRANPSNNNLWWWVDNTNTSKKWPCEYEFHIPSWNELQSLLTNMTNICWITNWKEFTLYLLMPVYAFWQPNAEYLYTPPHYIYTALTTSWWSTSYYVSCSVWNDDNNCTALCIFSNYSWRVGVSESSKENCFVIRPFYNKWIKPDNWWILVYKPQLVTKTYNEIITMATNEWYFNWNHRQNTLSELNKYPFIYFQKFNEESEIQATDKNVTNYLIWTRETDTQLSAVREICYDASKNLWKDWWYII